ncbi:hypothetical protein Dimus_008011 [Dionaea muscipula]
MQRQSLGSPGSKLHIHGGSTDKASISKVTDDHSRRDSSSSSPPIIVTAADADEIKIDKPLRGSHSRPEKFIHLIPILTLLCFLILYLCSHEPSDDKVLDQFGGSKQTLKPIEFGSDSSSEIDDLAGYLGEVSGEIVGIRRQRNLQEMVKHGDEEEENPKPVSHRKLGVF